MKKINTALLAFITSFNLSAQTYNSAIARKLVSKMTLEEKASLVAGRGMKIPGKNPPSGPVAGE